MRLAKVMGGQMQPGLKAFKKGGAVKVNDNDADDKKRGGKVKKCNGGKVKK